jgi:tetratricopeptide (TPR) repeat protein
LEPSPHPRLERPQALALLLPVALAVAGYWRSLRGEFQFDDIQGIAGNLALKGFGPWLRANLDLETFLLERPLTTLTFAANHAVGRLDPLGYHAVNLVLHLVVVVLAALLAFRVAVLAGAGRPGRIAVGLAGLLAVHPLLSQAVSYVSQRAEVLASALYLATLLLLVPGGEGRPRGLRWLALGTFVLGLAAKPVVVTLPVAWLAIRVATGPSTTVEVEAQWRRARPVLAAIAAAAGLFAVAVLVHLRSRPDAGFSVAGTGPWPYFLTQLRAQVVYLRLLAWPAGQSVDWDFPTSPGLGDPATLGAAAVILAAVGAAVLLLVLGRRRTAPGGATARLAGLGLCWFFILLAPTSSLVPLPDNLVEHRVYLASWGVFLAAVACADALAARLGARWLATGAWLAVLLLLAGVLHRRNAAWESREALWSDVLARSPGSARARMNLGEALDEQGRYEEAIPQYQLALAGVSGNAGQRSKILLNLGAAQFFAGRAEEARRSFEEGLHFRPDDALLLVNLGTLAGAAAAESYARRALRASPAQPRAWVILGNLALERGDWPEALSAYDRAAAMDPDLGEAHYGRSLALGQLGRPQEACGAERAALGARLAPATRATILSRPMAGCR